MILLLFYVNQQQCTKKVRLDRTHLKEIKIYVCFEKAELLVLSQLVFVASSYDV